MEQLTTTGTVTAGQIIYIRSRAMRVVSVVGVTATLMTVSRWERFTEWAHYKWGRAQNLFWSIFDGEE